jgi:hypothetical protein
MNDQKTPTAAERIAASEERRAKKATAEATAREEQFANDLEAIEKLEDELGIGLRYSSQVKTYVPGLPVVVGVRAPEPGEYKRFQSKMNRQNVTGDQKVAALIELAQMCWKYPADKDTRDAMVEANTALLSSVGQFVNSLAEVEIKEEGKG